jgi:hypothetical protein
MSFVQSEAVLVTTNSSGESTSFSTGTYNGLLQAIHYQRSSTASAMSTAASLTVTGEASGITYLQSALSSTIDQTFMPRGRTHYATSTAESGGENQLPVCMERFKFVVSSGGNAKTGTFRPVVI